MKVVSQAVSVYLMLVAIAIVINWIATPVYYSASTGYTSWEILDWFMMVALVLMVFVNVRRKLAYISDPDEGVTRRYFEVNVAFYASIVLVMWFMANWFGGLFGNREGDLVFEIRLGMWQFINPLFVLVLGSTSAAIWRRVTGG